MLSLRKYTSILFLFLFVFPFVQKGLHDMEHADEIHCGDRSSAHFHELSHTCNLCDYTPGTSQVPFDPAGFSFIQPSSAFLFGEAEPALFKIVKYSFLLRGPPVLS